MLTIAHRLSTIVDNDKIICLSEGELKNFGRPHALLYDETSVLYDLTKKLSSVEKQVIHQIVNENVERYERMQVQDGKYENLKSRLVDFKATSSDDDDHSESGRAMEKVAIMQKPASYGSTGT